VFALFRASGFWDSFLFGLVPSSFDFVFVFFFLFFFPVCFLFSCFFKFFFFLILKSSDGSRVFPCATPPGGRPVCLFVCLFLGGGGGGCVFFSCVLFPGPGLLLSVRGRVEGFPGRIGSRRGTADSRGAGRLGTRDSRLPPPARTRPGVEGLLSVRGRVEGFTGRSRESPRDCRFARESRVSRGEAFPTEPFALGGGSWRCLTRGFLES
jgi:hypothetical protein